MTLDWKIGGVLLGGVFFLAVLLVKPIGVSTQFVILDGIIGDVVNLASRLEQLTKQFEQEILISEEIAEAASREGLETQFIGEVSIKGRETREKIYTARRPTLSSHLHAGSAASEQKTRWYGNPENVESVSRNYRVHGEVNGLDFSGKHLNFKRYLALAAGVSAVVGLYFVLAT